MKRTLLFLSVFLLPMAAHAGLRNPPSTTISLTNTLQAGATLYVSSGTFATQLNVPNGVTAGNAAAFGQIKWIKSNFCNVATSSSTSYTTFTPTLMTCSITPSSASDVIMIFVTGGLSLNDTTVNRAGYATILRGATDLSPGDGFASTKNYVSGATAVALNSGNMTWEDSPATASAVSYTVGIRCSNAISTTTWNSDTSQSTSMLLIDAVAP